MDTTTYVATLYSISTGTNMKPIRSEMHTFCLGNLKGADQMGDRDTWENVKRILKKQNARV
jgi:hypothetical protein